MTVKSRAINISGRQNHFEALSFFHVLQYEATWLKTLTTESRPKKHRREKFAIVIGISHYLFFYI